MSETARALPREAPLWPVLATGVAALALACAFGLEWGSQPVGLREALSAEAGREAEIAREIVWRLRLPQVVMAAMVGGVLALAGMLFQALLRNPLASPFTLGLAGGGSLGAFAVISLESTALLAPLAATLAPWGLASTRALGAFAGVLMTAALVFALARAAGGVQTVTLLLAGVTLNYICAAGVMLMQSIADFSQTMSMVRWSMGGFELGAGQIPATAVLAGIGLAITVPALRHLDVLSVGDTTARLLGVQVRRVRAQIILGSSVMVGACLAVAGPIGFVDLIVPHMARLLVGPGHRRLIPTTMLFGAALLVAADALGRGMPSHLLGRSGVLPVGILTAVIGGPFFLALLLGMGRKRALVSPQP